MKQVLFVLFLYVAVHTNAQERVLDSLQLLVSSTQKNNSKINYLNEIAYQNYVLGKNDSAVFYAEKAIVLAKPLNNKQALGRAYNTKCLSYVELKQLAEAKQAYEETKKCFENNEFPENRIEEIIKARVQFGYLNYNSGNNEMAHFVFKDVLDFTKKMKRLGDMADVYICLSIVYSTQGNYVESLKNDIEGLKLYEKIGNEHGMALSYNDIGDTYLLLGDKEKAIEYFSKGYVLSKKNNLYTTASLACYNIGDLYFQNKSFPLSLQYAQIALELANKENDYYEKGNALLLIGKLYREDKKYEKALSTQHESIICFNKSEAKLEAYEPLSEISKIYFEKEDYSNAIAFGERALKLAQEMKSPLAVKISTETLFKSYQKTGNYPKAFETHLLFITSRDSVSNENNHKELLKQEYKKQVLADSLKYVSDKKITEIKTEETLKAERNKRIGLSIGLGLAVIFGGVLFNRFRVTQKQKSTIEEQNEKLAHTHHQLEQKTKQIQDSILYSKEIQNVFLKSFAEENTFFKDAILLYSPKDVVSGDFYWYKELGDNLMVLIGDCTGHGVPGAIISVLAIQSLEKLTANITNINELHVLNNLLREEFNSYYQTESRVSIGLDYSVLCINKKENKLYISGSSAAIIIKDKSNHVVVERFDSINIGGKMPVIYNPKTVTRNCNEVDSVYLYTDGIIDQRGGTEGKKFGTKQFVHLIESINTNNSSQALAKIEASIDNWKQNEVQIDDITLLGLQLAE